MRIAILVTAIGTGLSTGVFFAFSTFVMSGLRRVPAQAGITAMNGINRAAPTPLFMLALFGSAVSCCVLAVWAIVQHGEPASMYLLVGSLLHIAGVVLTTVYHIPRNNALGRLGPSTEDAANYWATYVVNWTRWNHVRLLASLAGTVLLVLSATK